MHNKPIKKIAIIHDLCGIGKAALTNIIPILSVMGYEPCPVPTMLLSTHTGGFGKPAILKTKYYIKEVIKHYKENNISFDAILVGYIGDKEIVKDVLEFITELRKEEALIIFDPIFGDGGKYYSNFDDEYINSIKDVIKYSDVITPNYTEASYLANNRYIEKPTEAQYLDIFKKLKELGSEKVVITSCFEDEDGFISTRFYENAKIKKITTEKLGKSYPGTGDIFVSVLLGYLMQQKSLHEAVNEAVDFVFKAIKKSITYNYDTKNGLILEYSLKELS